MGRLPNRYQLWAFFVLTLVIGWFPWYTGYGSVFLPAPTLAALIVAGLAGGRRGLLPILQRMARWRVSLGWYAFVLFVPAGICLLAVSAHVLLGGARPSFSMLLNDQHRIVMVFIAFSLPWQSSAFMEEIGFRGYALALHQTKWGPLLGTLILGTFFGAWLLPEFTRPDSVQYAMGGLRFYLWFVLTEIGWSLIMTWVYNRTAGSALVSGYLFHVAFNAWTLMLLTDAVPGEPLPPFDGTLFIINTFVVLLFALVIVLRTGGRLGYESRLGTPRSSAPLE